MKFCKDCAHYAEVPLATPWHQCRAPKNQSTDLVTGNVKCTLSPAEQRSSERPAGKFCGSDGNWWEPRATKVTIDVPRPVKKPWYKFWS